MYKIYEDISRKNNEKNQAKLDRKINEVIDKIKMNQKYKKKINIIKGIYYLLLSLDTDKKNELYIKIENLKSLIDKDKEIKSSLKYIDEFLENNRDIKEENSIIKFLEFLNLYPQLIKWLFETNFDSLYQFIRDSHFNHYLYLSNIKQIKDYFENLRQRSAVYIIKQIFNLENENQIFIQNINDFCYKYPDLEKLSHIKEGKVQDFNSLLNELNKAIFLIQFNPEKQLFSLESIKLDEKELIDEYKQLIIEKSFFAINHSIQGDEIYEKLIKIMEINNYIKEYISLLNNKRNILYANEEKIYLKISNNDIFNISDRILIKKLIAKFKIKEVEENEILNKY